jgi:dTMP kinase
VTTCHDPGSTPAGTAIRDILLNRKDIHLAPTTEMLLYMAARSQLVSEIISPALDRGEWVVSDRYLLANIVYQGYAGGLDTERIRQVGHIATEGLLPGLTLVLDIDLDVSTSRLNRPLDKLENRGEEYRRKLRAGYLAEASHHPEAIQVIRSDLPMTEVSQLIQSAVMNHYPELAQ